MMPTGRISLSEKQRQTLCAVGDALIPRSGEMPSASEAGIGGELIDAVLRSREDLIEDLRRILDEVADEEPSDALADLSTADPDGLATLRFVVAGGYLMSSEVGLLLGYPGQQEKQVSPYDYVALVESGLLDPVVERGPIYRPAPSAVKASKSSGHD